MKILGLFAISLLAMVACGRKEEVQEDRAADEVETVAVFEEIESKVNSPGRPWANHIGLYHEIFNDSNYIQYKSAERLGIDPLKSLFDAYNTRRPLVKIESGENYQVDDLTHSMPYLVPEAAILLEEIGDEFGTILEERGGDRENNKILVTSVLRSPYTVKRLRRVNRNAVDSSTHMFGTTFDIAWNHFYYPDSTRTVEAGILKGILAEVLLRKRNEGKCWVKYERKTPCFHITVK